MQHHSSPDVTKAIMSSASQLPYEKIPDELLVRIFRLAGGASVSVQGTRNLIGHVCKSWRRLSRSTRSLWSEITIEALNDQEMANEGWPVDNTVPDVSLVEQCLILSKTHPLDIRIVLTAPDLPFNTQFILHNAIALLLTHTIRWRTFTCIGPKWLLHRLACLHRCQSTRLEAITLGCTEGVESLGLTHRDVTFSASLRHLDINFLFPQLKPQWSKITSLRMGFPTSSNCHIVLSQMTNLVSLHLIHIGDSEAAPVQHTPILLHDLRQLKLSACAISEALDALQVPNLEQLHFTQPGSEDDCVAHASHLFEWGVCPNSSNHVTMERISRLVQGVPLRVLDVAWAVNLDALVPILRLHFQEVTALRVQLHPENVDSAPSLLDALVASSAEDPILPNLSEFSLGFSRCQDIIFRGEKLENMIQSRWITDSDKIKRLVTLRLWGNLASMPYRYHDEEITDILRGYMLSSLSLTLQDFEEQGLDVQWVFEGTFNILEEARRHAEQLL